MMIETWCPKKYKCLYDPNGKEPDIDQVMESLRSIGKKWNKKNYNHLVNIMNTT